MFCMLDLIVLILSGTWRGGSIHHQFIQCYWWSQAGKCNHCLFTNNKEWWSHLFCRLDIIVYKCGIHTLPKMDFPSQTRSLRNCNPKRASAKVPQTIFFLIYICFLQNLPIFVCVSFFSLLMLRSVKRQGTKRSLVPELFPYLYHIQLIVSFKRKILLERI